MLSSALEFKFYENTRGWSGNFFYPHFVIVIDENEENSDEEIPDFLQGEEVEKI